MDQALSTAEQDYLKNIYTLEHECGRATTQALATRLGVKAASVTAMVKRLAEDATGPYLTHTPYHGMELTARGHAVALEVLRHHRLLELYLAEHLGVPWDQVHAEAERLEHVISEDLEERIAAKLGQPTRDPHGDPIPSRDGVMDETDGVPLTELSVGASATLSRVPDGDPALLQYLGTLGLVPGAAIVVAEVAPYGDVLHVRVGALTHAVGGPIARRVLAWPEETLIAGAPADQADAVSWDRLQSQEAPETAATR